MMRKLGGPSNFERDVALLARIYPSHVNSPPLWTLKLTDQANGSDEDQSKANNQAKHDQLMIISNRYYNTSRNNMHAILKQELTISSHQFKCSRKAVRSYLHIVKEQNEAKENLYDHNSFLYYHIVKDKRVVLEYKFSWSILSAR